MNGNVTMPNPAQRRDPGWWAQRLLRTPAGGLLVRPWLDPAVLFSLRRWYFPLSRLWAAANEAGGDIDAWQSGLDAGRVGRLAAPLAMASLRRHEVARQRMASARDRWLDASFGGGRSEGAALAQLDRERRQAATRHMVTRGLFYPQLLAGNTISARWEVPSPEAVRTIWGAALAAPTTAYRAPSAQPEVTESPIVSHGSGEELWLRFRTPSPRLAARPETAWCYARVLQPSGGGPMPTLIAGNGLCVESDLLWPATLDAAAVGRFGAKVRVVEIFSAYHGLRALNGRYGGEPFFATAPLGVLDLVIGQTLETAVLIGWLRARFGGKVAVGGISMSSFVAQQVASRCGDWPAELRPDAAMLVSHSGDIAEVTFRSALVQALGLDRQLTAGGWDETELTRWAPLLDPTDEPGLPPERIVSALGTTDQVLPYSGGTSLAERWRLPAENVFRFQFGHMAMPLQLLRDGRPFERLLEVMRA